MTTIPSRPRGGIHGTENIIVRIYDLEEADRISKQLLANAELLSQTRAIHIVVSDTTAEDTTNEASTTQPTSDINASADREDGASAKSSESKSDQPKNDRDRYFDKDYIDERMNAYCEPIIQILHGISNAGGALDSFSWTSEDGWGSMDGTRPKEFWNALWEHARTLRKLDLGFYVHEVWKVPAPQVPFPEMKELKMDTTTAHGDEAAAVDALLGGSRNLERLEFSWPSCDLDGCQIKGIRWEYDFPSLKRLELSGYDFNPAAFTRFLGRCSMVEVLKDSTDLDSVDDTDDVQLIKLQPHILPKVKALRKLLHGDCRTLPEYLDPAAGRAIRHLFVKGYGWHGLDGVVQGANTLRCLEIDSSVTNWRRPEPDSDDEGVVPADDQELWGLPKQVKDLLPKLTGLQELGISLESGNISMRRDDGEWGNPDPMCAENLKTVLSVLPSESKIRALRVWDEMAKGLPKELLDDMPNVPEGLEYLGWEGEEKVLYKLVREDGKVRAVECEPLREASGDDWSEKRILEY